ncbi:MAG: hypothetical protein KME46_21925 [Brasilonema angustatum HA4187-MV1]|jgi:cytochrome c biogenesis protein CcdA|nr:hypothetical protein [Brasilonema angustatum HA4187-MV1]
MKTIHHAQQEVATIRQEVNASYIRMEQKIEAHLCEVKTELTKEAEKKGAGCNGETSLRGLVFSLLSTPCSVSSLTAIRAAIPGGQGNGSKSKT